MPENVNTSTLSVESEVALNEDPRPTMVSVDHVTMSFNMASEQLNSLKEYAIKLVQRDLFFKEFKALDDVTFEVKKGDVFGIIGTNGSGKSTVLKIIAGVLDPTQGSCTVNGNIAPLIELGAGFDLELSARENIYLNGALLGYSKEFIDENFDAIVDFAEVEAFLDMPMKNYSSGMVARIAFAIATIIVPDILIVDEVLAVGDFMFQKKCEERISELIERYGVTVLIVSHSNEQISRLCNKAVWIEKGHVRLLGDAADVCRIYGALGGRTGDRKAEELIFDSLIRSAQITEDVSNCFTITGENANAVCSKLVTKTWGMESVNVVALACANTHANSVVGNALASRLGAPILPVDENCLSEAVEGFLYSVQPTKIYVFDTEERMTESLDQLKRLSWNPEIVYFSNLKSHFDFSYDVFEYGLKNNLWKNELAVISFDDNPVAMAASPYLYGQALPVLMPIDSAKGRQEELLANACSKITERFGMAKLLTFGKGAYEVISELQFSDEVSFTPYAEASDPSSLLEIIELSEKTLEGRPFNVFLSSLARWPELQSAGCCVAKKQGVLVPIDEASLDSIKNSFDFLRRNARRVENLVFVGNDLAGSGLDARVFALQLQY